MDMEEKAKLEELAKKKCFMFDLDGTVYLSDRLLPGAAETLEYLKGFARVVYLTNNASVSRKSYVARLRRLGIAAEEKDIYTSATATVDYLKANYPGATVNVFGSEDLKNEIAGAHIRVDDKRFDMIVLGYKTDCTFADLTRLCSEVYDGTPYIATHGDPFCPIEGGIMPDVGSFAALVQNATGKAPLSICGKPYDPMINGAVKASGVRAEDTAVVGDRLSTDMEFAMRSGMTSVLVLTGDADVEDAKRYRKMPDFIFGHIGEFGEAVAKLRRS